MGEEICVYCERFDYIEEYPATVFDPGTICKRTGEKTLPEWDCEWFKRRIEDREPEKQSKLDPFISIS